MLMRKKKKKKKKKKKRKKKEKKTSLFFGSKVAKPAVRGKCWDNTGPNRQNIS